MLSVVAQICVSLSRSPSTKQLTLLCSLLHALQVTRAAGAMMAWEVAGLAHEVGIALPFLMAVPELCLFFSAGAPLSKHDIIALVEVYSSSRPQPFPMGTLALFAICTWVV